MIQAIHTAIPGRARYHLDELYRSDALKWYLERTLTQQPEIRTVAANPVTATVLVEFQPQHSPTAIAQRLEKAVQTFKQQRSTPAEATHRQLSTSAGEAQPIEDWHLQPLEAVLTRLDSSQTGLTSEAAENRLQQYGENTLTLSQGRSNLDILIDQFKSLPVALLGAAAGVSIFTEGVADALVILGVVGVNAVIGYVTESQSEKVIQSLKEEDNLSAIAIREGERTEIPIETVVPGELLVLKAGTNVAADARVLEANSLSVDESALTGESVPVSKTPDPLVGETIPLAERHNMVYKGTFVTAGEGLAVVVATGRFTEMGQIQSMVGETTTATTPLQQQLDEVGTQLVLLGSGICGLVLGLGLLRRYGFLQMLKTSISLAVAAVPEGLPTIATTILALGIREMRQHKILVRGLNAVEALGSVQTICLDKTGTLTQNQMVVAEVHTGGRVIQIHNGEFRLDDQPLNPHDLEALIKMLQVSVLCSESELEEQPDGEVVLKGSATENALIHLALAADLDVKTLRQKHPLLQLNQRTENRSLMSTVHDTPERQQWVAVKGSPSEVLERCGYKLEAEAILPLSENDRRAIELENERMAGKALRVLGLAYNQIDDPDAGIDPEAELIWLGLIGMADPLREGVKGLIADFHRAGIRTVMITGDQSPTAYAIGKALHLSRGQHLEILDSSDLDRLEPEAMQALFDKVDIFARISPGDKLQVVQALQAAGKVVAMTGDGINDTPALKAANVGVAMGRAGGKVVHEVADIIIEDDRLETMILAVSQGRTIYSNIRKSVHFLLATNLSEIMVMATATALNLGQPLNALQLLWLNLVTDIFPGLALALEPPEPDVLNHPPRSPDEPIIQPQDFQRIGWESAVISLSTLGAYGYGLVRYGAGPRASTIGFMSLTLGQLLYAISCRSQQHSIFDWQDQLPPNPYLYGALGGTVALQLVPMAIPGLRNLLQLAPIDLVDGLVIGSSAVLPFALNEIDKKTNQGDFP